jgi:hypothetical protein
MKTVDELIERLQTANRVPLRTPGTNPIMAHEIPDMLLVLALEIQRLRDAKTDSA